MKTQMRVQKILMLVSLVVSALVFVYALIFMTGGLADVYRFIDKTDGDLINCTKFVSTSQNFVSTLVAFGIVMVVLVAVMYLMACNSRRKYYITNYIAVGLFVVFALVVAIYLVAMVATIMDLYQNGILWDSGEGETIVKTIEQYMLYDPETCGPLGYVSDEFGYAIDVSGNRIISGYEYPLVACNYADMSPYFPDYVLDPNQTYNFVLGFVMFVIVLADAVCVTLCTVWKVLLMKGEKELLANGAPATENAAEAEEIAPAELQSAEVVEEVASADNPVKEEE